MEPDKSFILSVPSIITVALKRSFLSVNTAPGGIIPPGAVLTDKKERFKATVSIDGTLKIKDLSGSIHQMGAKIQGLPSCNGWDFWHVKDKSKSILLDEIRSNYRKDKLN